MLSEGEDAAKGEELPGGKMVSENRQHLLALRDRMAKEIETAKPLITNGETILLNPLFNYYKDVLNTLIQIESKEQHDEYKREDLIIAQTMRQTGDIETHVDSDFEAFCKKYGISLTRKEDKRVSYDKS
jgi:hypothetical protein